MKKIFLYPFKLLDGLIDRVLAVAGALILVQFPQFYAQYLQRLGGHLDEAKHNVAQYAKAAADNQVTLQEYINIHLNSGNKVFIATGKIIQGLVQRLAHLEASVKALKEAKPIERLWVFLQQADPRIAKQTWANYVPGIPTTIEALVYALIGLLLAWGVYQGIKSMIGLLFRLFTRKPEPSQSLPGGDGLSI